MSGARPTSTSWTARRKLAWGLRLSTVVIPLAVAIGAMVLVAHLVARPRHGVLMAGWYAMLLAISYAASWATGKVMDRTLPLAALLELSLCFPERAPSRLGLSQRSGSAQELTRLATAPPDETTQAAAERILKLLSALSVHDRFTRGHAERVRAYADLIAEKMGLPPDQREHLRWAALLHDIGKLRVPAALLNKPGRPDAAEWEQLKSHPVQGSIIAAPLLDWLRPMDRVIAEHHERFDGTGYPAGLAGETISQGARIVTVADCFEAMTAVRSYNRPMKRDAAMAELVRCAGSQFDPVVVRALLAVPHRRLLLAMGPTAWLAGLPMVGQGSLGVLRTTVSHGAAAALGATAVAMAAVVPLSLFSVASASGPATPAPAQPAPGRPAPAPSTVGAHQPAPTSAAPSALPSLTPAPPTTGAAPTPAAPTTTPRRTPATPTRAKPTPTHQSVSNPPPPVTVAPPTTTEPPTTPGVPTPAPDPAGTPAKPTTTPSTSPRPTSPKPTTPTPTTSAGRPTVSITVPITVPITLPTLPITTTSPTKTAQPTVTPTTGPAPAAQCSATYTSASGSASTLLADITVTDTGSAATSGWTVTWAWATGNQKVTLAIDATVGQAGKSVTATNGLLNGVVLSGGSTVFIIAGQGHAASPPPILTCLVR